MTQRRITALAKVSLMLAAFCLPSAFLRAAPFSFFVNQPVPDGTAVGLADTQAISGLDGAISSLTVDLQLDGRFNGGWNGDLYVTLVHDTGFSVLINRPGKRGVAPLGFSDNGMNIIIDDSAANGDVHNYRLPLTGDLDIPLLGPLAGAWQSDARSVDPDFVVDSDIRNSTLSEFTGLDPNGQWILFVADLEYGGTFQLEGWGLNIETVATTIPDSPLEGVEICILLLVLFSERIRAFLA